MSGATKITRRDLAALGSTAFIAAMLPHRLFANGLQARGDNPPDIALRLVDPQLRAPFLSQPTVVNAATLPQVRANMVAGIKPYLARPTVNARLIPGSTGAPDVPIFVINAESDPPSQKSSPRPALLYLHGGGYVAGSAAGEMVMAQQIALDHDCVVVSVDYRLAPEVRFPGALEDNYAALKWLHTNAAGLGVDANRIALMGTSAGGGHVAMLSATARDRGEVPIHFQLLLSPMLDDRTGSSKMVPPHIGALIWTSAANRFGWSSFLGVDAGSRNVPRGAVPSRLSDLKGLPPTYIGVGSIDLFVDENVEYARRLVEAGVPVELNVVPGAYHVFFAIMPNADISKQFHVSFNQALARSFQRSATAS